MNKSYDDYCTLHGPSLPAYAGLCRDLILGNAVPAPAGLNAGSKQTLTVQASRQEHTAVIKKDLPQSIEDCTFELYEVPAHNLTEKQSSDQGATCINAIFLTQGAAEVFEQGNASEYTTLKRNVEYLFQNESRDMKGKAKSVWPGIESWEAYLALKGCKLLVLQKKPGARSDLDVFDFPTMLGGDAEAKPLYIWADGQDLKVARFKAVKFLDIDEQMPEPVVAVNGAVGLHKMVPGAPNTAKAHTHAYLSPPHSKSMAERAAFRAMVDQARAMRAARTGW